VDASFWHDKWQRNQIGFHEPQANPLLLAHFDSLSLRAGSRIFVPLCGKTLDINWLLARGQRVVGAELSEIAVQQLFAGLGVTRTSIFSMAISSICPAVSWAKSMPSMTEPR
jgi:thiopurine S-methyltransferase